MKAVLVNVSLMTRVVVDENATEEQILEKAKAKFMEKIETELSEHLEEIVDDEECPYDPEFDTYGFKTHNQKDICIGGTHLQGYVDVDFKTLKKVFGTPIDGDYKTDAEWCIEFNDGTIATIYNYKDGKNYNGRSGTATSKIRDWHIGGFDEKAVEMVKKVLGI